MLIRKIKENFYGTAKRRSMKQTTIGTAIGVLLGAAAGVLLAPKSGKATRKAIKAVALKGAESAAEAARTAVRLTKKESEAVKNKRDKEAAGNSIKNTQE